MSARLTDEMRHEHETFCAIIGQALGPRVRVRRDAREAEGWPEAPARYGTLHWRGRHWQTAAARIYAYTDRPRLIAKLLAIPGVHRCQMGDREAAVSMAAGDTAAIQAVAGLLRMRVRRAPETGRLAEALAAVRPRSNAANGLE